MENVKSKLNLVATNSECHCDILNVMFFHVIPKTTVRSAHYTLIITAFNTSHLLIQYVYLSLNSKN